jgi:hypothetical protein
MDSKFTHHVTLFNDRVRAMNQMNKPDLRLTAVEANNLLSDIFAVFAQMAVQNQQITENKSEVIEVQLNGGGFK